MLYPLSQRRAHFNRNKERVEKIVLRHRREKVALSNAAAVAIQGATRALILRLDGLYNAALDTRHFLDTSQPNPIRAAPEWPEEVTARAELPLSSEASSDASARSKALAPRARFCSGK